MLTTVWCLQPLKRSAVLLSASGIYTNPVLQCWLFFLSLLRGHVDLHVDGKSNSASVMNGERLWPPWVKIAGMMDFICYSCHFVVWAGVMSCFLSGKSLYYSHRAVALYFRVKLTKLVQVIFYLKIKKIRCVIYLFKTCYLFILQDYFTHVKPIF